MSDADRYPLGAKNSPDPVHYQAFKPKTAHSKVGDNLSYENWFDGIDDQGPHGTCVAWGVDDMFEFGQRKHHDFRIELSARATYAETKYLNPTTEDTGDTGLWPSDCIKLLMDKYCVEADWPTDNTMPLEQFMQRPPSGVWRTNLRTISFESVDTKDIELIRVAMFEKGPLLMAGPWPDEYFYPDANGTLPKPDLIISDPSNWGGHCTRVIGFSNKRSAAFCRNQWGKQWGAQGYFWMPYENFNSPAGPNNLYAIKNP